MGVYCLVHICIAGSAPLPVDIRLATVELAITHQLITRDAAITAPATRPPRGILDRIKRVFVPPEPYFGTVDEGAPGPWIGERMRALDGTTDYRVSSGFPVWKGVELTGPFRYEALRTPRPVKVVNLYRSPEERRSPHEPADGVIGSFWDVLSVDAKRGFDARAAASSTFVRELKSLTGQKVICRSSWV